MNEKKSYFRVRLIDDTVDAFHSPVYIYIYIYIFSVFQITNTMSN